ncbi:MAG: type II secretion system F family protein [Actinobacteria bacterium]|nr:type II secretion system F family protein [Actinomycetota bacterium]
MPDVLAGAAGQVLLAVLVAAAAALLAWAGLQTFAPRSTVLADALSPYAASDRRERGEVNEAEDIGDRLGLHLVKTDIVRRAIESLAGVGPGVRVVAWLERRLDQANVPLRAAEALVAYAVGAVLAAVGALLFIGPVFAIGLGAGLTALPLAALSVLAGRRRVRFARQLPDALKLLSGTLRAGFSLIQGVETIAREVGDPMGNELQRVLAEARLGRSLDSALADMASRVESADFEWTVMAIGIQREVGGNLAELLDTVAETMLARDRLRREVSALTAEGRISAIVIGLLPVGLGAFMWIANREYISVLTESTIGQTIAVGSALLAAFGFWWMKKTIEIEV